jgi:two-component system, NtrC family, sensor kinase
LASLRIIQGPDKDRSFELREGENFVGRQAEPIMLKDGTVSRQHARLIVIGGRWTLEDLGSANGTFLNGVKVRSLTVVHPGDQIRCGSTILVFAGAGEPAAVSMDENGSLVDAAIVATMPSNEDSVIIPTPEAGQQAIGNLRILYDLISEIGSIFHVDMLLRRTLDKIFDVLPADRGYILLFENPDRPGGDLKLRAFRHSGEQPAPKAPISRTIINEVVTKQVGVLSSNAMSDKRFTSGKSVHDLGIRSALCAPIKGRERILGVIHVDCSVSDHTYSTEQLRLLTAIGFQTGLAVENVRLYEQAVQTERLAAVGETAAFLSHHIKNILQALQGGIDMVEAGLKKNEVEKARDAWPIVERNLSRIHHLILNMLALSKSRQPLLESINVNRVLEECLQLAGPQSDDRDVALLSDLDEMPPIPADAEGLHQAFLNLIQNALDAVPEKTGVVTVSSSFDAMTRSVVVRVSDNGAGIDPEKLDRIFTPFYSAKGQRGTGLGLSVAKKIVEEHQGTLDVSTKVGEGTLFTIKLPAVPRGSAADTTGPGK